LIAAEYAGVSIEVVPVTMGVTNKTKEFLALNPWGKVPTLETDDGQGIWESNAIARFVAASATQENNLFGRSLLERGQVEQWMDWVRGDLELAASVWLYPIYGLIPNNPVATAKAKQDIHRLMGVLSNYLNDKSYLVGEGITLADIVVACTLVPLYSKVFDRAYRQSFPNVTRWFETVVNQPNFKKVQDEVHLCEKMEVAGGDDAQDDNVEAPEPEKSEEPAKAEEPSNDEAPAANVEEPAEAPASAEAQEATDNAE